MYVSTALLVMFYRLASITLSNLEFKLCPGNFGHHCILHPDQYQTLASQIGRIWIDSTGLRSEYNSLALYRLCTIYESLM